MKSNWLLITQNNDHSYLNAFAQTLQEHPADVGVLQGSSNIVHYLPNIATASYDTVLIAQAVLANAPVEAYIHWLACSNPKAICAYNATVSTQSKPRWCSSTPSSPTFAP